MPWQDNIGLPGKSRIMNPKAKSQSVNNRPDNDLRPRVSTSDTGHVLASLFLCQSVGHCEFILAEKWGH